MVKSAYGKGRYRHALVIPLKKLIMLLSVLVILCMTVPARAHVFSKTVSLAAKDMPLEKVFAEIKKQTGYTFAYFESDLAKAKPVNISVNNAKLTDVLTAIFENQPLTFTIVEKVIVVKQKNGEKKIVVSQDAVLALPIDVRGRVVNEKGDPIAGATVSIKGTKTGTATNGEGEFELKKIEATAILVITGVNIETIEAPVGGRKELILSVKGKTGKLDEVQVIAYGTTSQRFNTGNVTTIKAEDIEKQPVQNPLLTLQGRVPGLEVTQVNGISGGPITIRIQGQNSLINGNDPLIVVDGVPFPASMPGTGADIALASSLSGAKPSPLNFINPADIESIDVLKDADATAIYGSRAANGAILITTKKGKAGQSKLMVNFQQGWGKVTRMMDMMNTRQYLDMRYEALRNDNIAINPAKDYDLTLWDTTRYTNWQKELIGGTAQLTNVNATASGGTIAFQYLIGGTFQRQTTVFPGGLADTRGGLHFSISGATNSKKFRFQLSGSYMLDNNRVPRSDLTQAAIQMEPVAPPLYNTEGTLNWALNTSGNSTWNNPLAIALYRQFGSTANNMVSNITLSYMLLPGLDIRSSIGYTNLTINDYVGTSILAINPEDRNVTPNPRTATYGNRSVNTWIVEPQISYQKDIYLGKLDLLIGGTVQQNAVDGRNVIGKGYASDGLLKNPAAAVSITASNPAYTEYKYNGVFGRLNYVLLNRYIINLTARRDGSSRFGDNNKFHNFGSIGGAWIFSEEKWIDRKRTFFSFGKVRASYGTTGSDQIDDYSYLSLYGNITMGVPYQSVSAIAPTSLANSFLEWEETRKLQTGLDLGFVNDRFLLNVTYSRNRCSNQLLSYILPATTGFSSIASNLPATVQNTSWEFSLSTINVKIPFKWSSSINLTIPRNKLISFPGIETSPYGGLYAVDQPIGIIKLWHFIGVDTATGKNLFADEKGNPTTTPKSADLTVTMNNRPLFYGGFQNSIEFKGIQLDFLFQFVKQTSDLVDKYNGNSSISPGKFSSGMSNQPATLVGRWQKPGDITNVQKYSTSSSSLLFTGSDLLYGDASYIRLKNVSLSWQVPKSWMQTMRLQNCKVYMQAQNLLTITSYQGLDPETRNVIALPPLKMITAGVQVGL